MKITKTKKLHLTAMKVAGLVLIYAVSYFYGQHVQAVKTTDTTQPHTVKYAEEINEAANVHDVDPALIAAVIHAESNFKPFARSHVGAQGLMQIMPATQRYLGCKNGFDPRQNIYAGSKYLKQLLGMFRGNMVKTIAAYNAGPGAVKKFSGIPPYKETRGYVKKVLTYYKQYEKVFASDPMMS